MAILKIFDKDDNRWKVVVTGRDGTDGQDGIDGVRPDDIGIQYMTSASMIDVEKYIDELRSIRDDIRVSIADKGMNLSRDSHLDDYIASLEDIEVAEESDIKVGVGFHLDRAYEVSGFAISYGKTLILPTHQGGTSVTMVYDSAFRNNQLTSVIFSEGIRNIANSAFRNNQLTSITLPDSLTRIDGYAFADNPLTEVSISSNTTYSSDSFPSSAVITVR